MTASNETKESMESRLHQQQQQSAAAGISDDHKNILRRALIATLVAGVLVAVVYHKLPTDYYKGLKTPNDRLVYTIRCNALSVTMIFAMIAVIGNTRLTTKQINPLSHEDKERIEVHARVLQSTTEQFAVSFISQLAASTWMEQGQMVIIPIVVALFVLGQLLFWFGYLNPVNARTNRVMGLPLTMLSSFALIVYNVYKMATTCYFILGQEIPSIHTK